MPIRMVKKNKELKIDESKLEELKIEEEELKIEEEELKIEEEELKMTFEEIYEEQDIELMRNIKTSDYFFPRFFYEFGCNFFKFLYKIICFILKVGGVYLLWICLHFVSSHLYVKLCVPSTFIGFVMSPFMSATPHCQGLRWIVYNAANMINNMWIIFGAWICSTILIINKDTTPGNSS
jgi:hypothetical protein